MIAYVYGQPTPEGESDFPARRIDPAVARWHVVSVADSDCRYFTACGARVSTTLRCMTTIAVRDTTTPRARVAFQEFMARTKHRGEHDPFCETCAFDGESFE